MRRWKEYMQNLSGDNFDFQALCMPFTDALFVFAIRLCGGDRDAAADVLQDTLIRAWKAWDRWRPMEVGGSPKPWLFQILSNTYITAYHHGQCRPDRYRMIDDNRPTVQRMDDTGRFIEDTPELSYINELCHSVDPRAETADYGFSDEVQDAINRLPSDRRELILRHYVLGQEYLEIADEMRIDPGTVASRLARTRLDLEKILRVYARREKRMGYMPKKPRKEGRRIKRVQTPAEDHNLGVTVQ